MKKKVPAPKSWLRVDGTVVSCTESNRVLAENWEETAEVLQESYEDAVLLGVGKDAFRRAMHDLVDRLECGYAEKTAPIEALPKGEGKS